MLHFGKIYLHLFGKFVNLLFSFNIGYSSHKNYTAASIRRSQDGEQGDKVFDCVELWEHGVSKCVS